MREDPAYFISGNEHSRGKFVFLKLRVRVGINVFIAIVEGNREYFTRYCLAASNLLAGWGGALRAADFHATGIARTALISGGYVA